MDAEHDRAELERVADGPPGRAFLTLLDELQVIARNGLAYADGPYDRERYELLLTLTVEAYGTALDLPAPEVRARLASELGYVTPKVGCDAAAFDDEGRLLVIRRADDGRWSMPGGWMSPSEAPREAVAREVFEETGLVVEPVVLVDVFSRPAHSGWGPHGMVAIVFLCAVVGGEVRGSHESLEVAWRPIGDVEPWHEDHGVWAAAAQRVWAQRSTGHT